MSLLDLLYPPTCLSCKDLIPKYARFCSGCQERFTLIRKEGHCLKCFAEIPMVRGTCLSCRKNAHPFRRLASCFDAHGPAQSILDTYLREKSSALAKDIASYIIIQLHALDFPQFEAIIPFPRDFRGTFSFVVKEVAKLLEIPLLPILSFRFASDSEFFLKKKCNNIPEQVLLLGASLKDRSEIRSAGWALAKAVPGNLYGMTFCATL